MKDLNGKEIDFTDETLFPSEYMMPKKNHQNTEKIHSRFEEKDEDESAEEMADFMHHMDSVLK